MPPRRQEADRRAVLGELAGELPAQIEPCLTNRKVTAPPPLPPHAARLTKPFTHVQLFRHRKAQMVAQLEH